jgi:RNA polymerase sigma-54 factor
MATPSYSLGLVQDQRMSLVLAPQLRQSLEMLQVPVMELRSLIQEELEQNPTLEEIPIESQQIEVEKTDTSLEDKQELDFDEEFKSIIALDDEARDYFFPEERNSYSNSDTEEKRQYFLDSLPQQVSLQEHLIQQLELAGFNENEHEIAELIIGNINDDGYLTINIEELAENSGYEIHEMETMLDIIQEFEPTGVGARNLRECLLLQLHKGGHPDPLAESIIQDHLNLLGSRKLKDIAKRLNVSIEDIQHAADYIATLDPKPGRRFTTEVAAYVLPEVSVQKINGEYVIMLNDEQLPRLRISNHYRRLLESDQTPKEVKAYIRDRIKSSSFMIKSIEQRQKTIYKIASEIVSVQEKFLDEGIKHLRPLTMSEVAEACGVHETTVSRAVNGKYMSTPSGVFEMRYFFTTGLKTSDGSNISNQTIKDVIHKMVSEESPAEPLSDQEIMEKLKEQGISVARRTVAKYRTMLKIPPSHMRRSY